MKKTTKKIIINGTINDIKIAIDDLGKIILTMHNDIELLKLEVFKNTEKE